VTDKAVFSDAEWNLLVRLPRWVVTAASAAQSDGVLGTVAEEEVGLVSIAWGRESGNPFVADIAERLTYSFDDPDDGSAPGPDFADAAAGIAGVVDRARTAAQVLGAKADGVDASAYRHWLLTIGDQVIGASRSGGLLGIGADRVSESERQFRDQLEQALRG